MTSIAKKTLLDILSIISLKGLSEDKKTITMVDDAVIHFDHVDQTIRCYGEDTTNTIMFYLEFVFNEDEYPEFEMDELLIGNIANWMNYIKTLDGDISISLDDSNYVLESTKDGAYYHIPLPSRDAIKSFYSCADTGPLIMPTDDWLSFVHQDGSTVELDIDQYSRYSFDPSPFYNSIESGKTIDSMYTTLKLSKKKIEVTIGNITEPGKPAFIRPEVAGVTPIAINHEGTQEWSCQVGLHQITKALDVIKTDGESHMFFVAPSRNMVIVHEDNEESSIRIISKVKFVWSISPPAKADGSFSKR